jgi:hypothetical protein
MLACTLAVPQVLQLLIRLYEDCPEPDYTVICQCLMFLDDAPGVAKILNQLISSSGVSCRTPEQQQIGACVHVSHCAQVAAWCHGLFKQLLAIMAVQHARKVRQLPDNPQCLVYVFCAG